MRHKMASIAALAKISGLACACWMKAARIPRTVAKWVSEAEADCSPDVLGGQRRMQANNGRHPERISLLQHSTSSHSELIT